MALSTDHPGAPPGRRRSVGIAAAVIGALLISAILYRGFSGLFEDVQAEALTETHDYRATVSRPFEFMETSQRIEITDLRGWLPQRIARMCSINDSPAYPVWRGHRLVVTYPSGRAAAVAEVSDGKVTWTQTDGVGEC